MFQLDDKFLEEVGLGSLPDAQKKLFLDHFREQLELRVGLQLSEGLSDMQLAEFESFMDRDMVRVTSWLDANAPDFENDQIYVQLKANVPQNAILAEYASLKWLGQHRPNYREVVMQTVKALKEEVIANRDMILLGDAGA